MRVFAVPFPTGNMLRTIGCCLLSIWLAGCGAGFEYEKSFEIEGSQWAYEDSLRYAINIDDTLAIYNLYLEIEHARNYPFQNLYIQVHTTFPYGERLTETVSLELANQAGIWGGACRGETCTLQIPIQEDAYFNQPGSYTFVIEPYMRRNPLPGVRSVTFQLERTERRRQ